MKSFVVQEPRMRQQQRRMHKLPTAMKSIGWGRETDNKPLSLVLRMYFG